MKPLTQFVKMRNNRARRARVVIEQKDMNPYWAHVMSGERFEDIKDERTRLRVLAFWPDNLPLPSGKMGAS